MSQAGDSVRRSLADQSWLAHSKDDWAGMVHELDKPLRDRLADRKYCSPYYWSPSKPGTGRGFYQSSHKALQVDKAGSTFALRLEYANEYIATRLKRIVAYYTDDFSDDGLRPIIARLPHNRGFLAGWTMGEGMLATIEPDIYSTPQAAAFAAHDLAERDAEKERDYQATEREQLEREEREEQEALELEDSRPDMYQQS